MTATIRHLTVVPDEPRRLSLVESDSGARIYRLPVRRSAGCLKCALRAPGHGEAA